MAECRCGEIQALKREISQLEEVRAFQNEYNRYISEAKMYLGDVAVDSQKITESDKVREAEDSVRNLADRLEMVKSGMVARMNSQISHMRNRLSDIQSEDERHHREVREAEERRKQQEAEAKKKQEMSMYNRLPW